MTDCRPEVSRAREEGEMLDLTRCVIWASVSPALKWGGGPRLSGLGRVRGSGLGEGAARAPPKPAWRQRARAQGAARPRGGEGRERARGPAQAAAEPSGRACSCGAANSCGTHRSRRPCAGPPYGSRARPRAGERPGAGARPDRAGAGRGRGGGRAAGQPPTLGPSGARVPAHAPEAPRGTAGGCACGRSGRA